MSSVEEGRKDWKNTFFRS